LGERVEARAAKKFWPVSGSK